MVNRIAEGESEWHTEENTQRLLVAWLEREGWQIIRTANTATGEPGVDVIAERDGITLAVEVKGYPSRYYAKGPTKGQIKRSTPANQAPKWFAHALVPAMKIRTKEPQWRSAMCFPDFPVYRRLYADTRASLVTADITVWLVTESGDVEALS